MTEASSENSVADPPSVDFPSDKRPAGDQDGLEAGAQQEGVIITLVSLALF